MDVLLLSAFCGLTVKQLRLRGIANKGTLRRRDGKQSLLLHDLPGDPLSSRRSPGCITAAAPHCWSASRARQAPHGHCGRCRQSSDGMLSRITG